MNGDNADITHACYRVSNSKWTDTTSSETVIAFSFSSFTRTAKLLVRAVHHYIILLNGKEWKYEMKNSDKLYKVNFTASRHAWSRVASTQSRECIQPNPDNPLAKAITVSLVLVSPSTCSKMMQNKVRIHHS